MIGHEVREVRQQVNSKNSSLRRSEKIVKIVMPDPTAQRLQTFNPFKQGTGQVNPDIRLR